MEEFLYKHARRRLKKALYHERISADDVYLARCSICGLHLFEGTNSEMHEAIITRRDIMGFKGQKHTDVASRIMVRQNCVIVHSGDCHIEAQSNMTKPVKQIIYFEGFPAIIDWLESLRDVFRTHLVDEKQRLVMQIYEESINGD